MDALRADDIARARKASLELKALQALACMADGITLKRASLAAQHPLWDAAAIDLALRAWLRSDE